MQDLHSNVLVILTIFFQVGAYLWIVQPIAAFLGAVISTGILLKLVTSSQFHSTERLLLVGFALNAVFAAMATFILSLSLSRYGVSQSIVYWMLGGFSGKGWNHLLMAAPLFIGGLCIAYRISPKLNVINLGEDIAQSLGITLSQLKKWSIITISLLVGCSVAISGGVGFIGLIVPHITRMYLGAEHKKLLTSSIFNGMTLMIIADTVARTLWAPQELQVGAILAIIGAPTFVCLLILQKRRVWL